MYADKITRSMKETIDETERRRDKQLIYNEKMGITPAQIVKPASTVLKELSKRGVEYNAYIEPDKPDIAADPVIKYMSAEALEKAIKKTRRFRHFYWLIDCTTPTTVAGVNYGIKR